MIWQTKMMDIEYYARQEGREEGRTAGLEEGIQALVHTLQGLSIDRETIVSQLATQFNLSDSIAASKVDQYWRS